MCFNPILKTYQASFNVCSRKSFTPATGSSPMSQQIIDLAVSRVVCIMRHLIQHTDTIHHDMTTLSSLPSIPTRTQYLISGVVMVFFHVRKATRQLDKTEMDKFGKNSKSNKSTKISISEGLLVIVYGKQ